MSDTAEDPHTTPSRQEPSTPSSSAHAEPKKRGSRQLSEQQLAKKRQNDREAQRAIRERTRQTITALENKVKDLEGGQAYRQMQELVQEKDALRAENEDLKRRLADIIALCDPPLGTLSTRDPRMAMAVWQLFISALWSHFNTLHVDKRRSNKAMHFRLLFPPRASSIGWPSSANQREL